MNDHSHKCNSAQTLGLGGWSGPPGAVFVIICRNSYLLPMNSTELSHTLTPFKVGEDLLTFLYRLVQCLLHFSSN